MRSVASLIYVLGLVVGAAPAYAQHIPGAPQTDWDRATQEYTIEVLRAYNAMMQEWRDAWQAGNAQRAADFYADGASLLIEDRDLLQGKEAIRAYLETFLPGVVEIRTGLSDFVASDRLAYALGSVWYQIRGPSGGLESVQGTYLSVLVREGRRWRIRSQVFKSEQPKTTAAGSARDGVGL